MFSVGIGSGSFFAICGGLEARRLLDRNRNLVLAGQLRLARRLLHLVAATAATAARPGLHQPDDLIWILVGQHRLCLNRRAAVANEQQREQHEGRRANRATPAPPAPSASAAVRTETAYRRRGSRPGGPTDVQRKSFREVLAQCARALRAGRCWYSRARFSEPQLQKRCLEIAQRSIGRVTTLDGWRPLSPTVSVLRRISSYTLPTLFPSTLQSRRFPRRTSAGWPARRPREARCEWPPARRPRRSARRKCGRRAAGIRPSASSRPDRAWSDRARFPEHLDHRPARQHGAEGQQLNPSPLDPHDCSMSDATSGLSFARTVNDSAGKPACFSAFRPFCAHATS